MTVQWNWARFSRCQWTRSCITSFIAKRLGTPGIVGDKKNHFLMKLVWVLKCSVVVTCTIITDVHYLSLSRLPLYDLFFFLKKSGPLHSSALIAQLPSRIWDTLPCPLLFAPVVIERLDISWHWPSFPLISGMTPGGASLCADPTTAPSTCCRGTRSTPTTLRWDWLSADATSTESRHRHLISKLSHNLDYRKTTWSLPVPVLKIKCVV